MAEHGKNVQEERAKHDSWPAPTVLDLVSLHLCQHVSQKREASTFWSLLHRNDITTFHQAAYLKRFYFRLSCDGWNPRASSITRTFDSRGASDWHICDRRYHRCIHGQGAQIRFCLRLPFLRRYALPLSYATHSISRYFARCWLIRAPREST